MANKSAIRQIYYRENKANDNMPLTYEYNELQTKRVKLENELQLKLKEYPDILKLYDKLNNSINEAVNELLAIHYEEGFKLGFDLAKDICYKPFIVNNHD